MKGNYIALENILSISGVNLHEFTSLTNISPSIYKIGFTIKIDYDIKDYWHIL